MINLMSTHESRLATLDTKGQGAFGPVIAGLALARAAMVSEVTDPADVSVPDYYPDVPLVRESIAQHYDNIHYMDAQVGEIMANLRADKLLDSTVVIWLTDHGDGLPRAKRSVYDSGLHIPMVIRSQQGKEAGGIDTRLISIVDLAPSILQLAGVPVPDFVQGQSMLDGEKSGIMCSLVVTVWIKCQIGCARCEINGTIRAQLPLGAAVLSTTGFSRHVSSYAGALAGNEAGSLSEQQQFYFVSPRPWRSYMTPCMTRTSW